MHLVTFLGTGRYQRTRYTLSDGRSVASDYVAHAITHLLDPDEVVVLATARAREQHGEGLVQALAGERAGVRFVDIPSGRTPAELWQQFDALRGALGEEGDLALDITHGFRSQPFLAAGTLSYLRMTGALEGRSVSVLYGRYLPDEPEESPIWDLTPFVELMDWAHGASVFVETGHAAPLVEVAQRTEQALRRQIAAAGGREFPRVNALVNALDDFAADLATVRVAALVTGYAQDDRKKAAAKGSAARLLRALKEFGAEVEVALPALAPLLERTRRAAEGIAAATLTGDEGLRALAALARRYLEFARYPEAATVLREAQVSRYATGPEAAEVNSADYDPGARARAEDAWGRADRDGQRAVAAVRNDLQHGGFNRQPLAARELVDRLGALVGEFPSAAATEPPPGGAGDGRRWFVSRHPGAREWAERQGLPVDRVVSHVDPDQVGWGDTVIGTLPVQLAAAVCERGARYLHLAMDLPEEARGRELSADDMERYGAVLRHFRVTAM